MSDLRIYSIRGATCAENSADSIKTAVGELCKNIFALNDVSQNELVNIQFTVTPDLDTLNPAAALRNSCTGLDTSKVPLFCSAEPVIKGMLPKVIRVMVTLYKPQGFIANNVYINGAQVLRPDLAGDSSL